jgi:hypothetical protein
VDPPVRRVPVEGYAPSGRSEAMSWLLNGTFCIFAGYAVSNGGFAQNAGDMWCKFDAVANPSGPWAYIIGTDAYSSNYGVFNQEDPDIYPYGRSFGCSLTRGEDQLILYGGNSFGKRNDVWLFNTTSLMFKWISGSNVFWWDASGTYPANSSLWSVFNSSYLPEGKTGQGCWIYNDTLYSFGGNGNNDMWLFNFQFRQWALMGYFSPSRGSQNVPSSSNWPGIADSYMTSQLRYETSSVAYVRFGVEIWSFDCDQFVWTWILTENSTSTYFGPRGVFSNASSPGAVGSLNTMFQMSAEHDKLFLFTSSGFNNNSMWALDLKTQTWAWISGLTSGNSVGNLGSLGILSSNIFPPGVNSSTLDYDPVSNSAIIFGGSGAQATDGSISYYSFVLQFQYMLQCPLGSELSQNNTVCATCSEGKYSSTLNSTSCFDCAPGYDSSEGSSTCQECVPGKFGAGRQRCEDCAPGTFSNAYNSSVCSQCSGGYVSNSTGATACFQCTRGSYSSSGSSNCTMCPIGTFSAAAGSADCTAGDLGMISTEVGATSCSSCETGKYAFNSSLCVECPRNASTSIIGAYSQDMCQCSEGFAGNAALGNDCIACMNSPGSSCPRGSLIPKVTLDIPEVSLTPLR